MRPCSRSRRGGLRSCRGRGRSRNASSDLRESLHRGRHLGGERNSHCVRLNTLITTWRKRGMSQVSLSYAQSKSCSSPLLSSSQRRSQLRNHPPSPSTFKSTLTKLPVSTVLLSSSPTLKPNPSLNSPSRSHPAHPSHPKKKNPHPPKK